MAEIAEGRTDVGLVARILRAGCSVQIRNVQRSDPRHAIEVKARVQQVRAGQPFGAERDLVFAAVHNRRAVCQRRLSVVMHVFGRAGCDKVQDMIGRIVGVGDHFPSMITNDPPGRGPVFE